MDKPKSPLSDEAITALSDKDLEALHNTAKTLKSQIKTLKDDLKDKEAILARHKELQRIKAATEDVDAALQRFRKNIIELVEQGHDAEAAFNEAEVPVIPSSERKAPVIDIFDLDTDVQERDDPYLRILERARIRNPFGEPIQRRGGGRQTATPIINWERDILNRDHQREHFRELSDYQTSLDDYINQF